MPILISHSMVAQLNRFYLLPNDLQTLIYSIIDNNAANKIIEYWYRYIHKKIIAINLMEQLPKELLQKHNGDIYIVYNPLTSNVMKTFEFGNKVLSGNEDNQWWSSKLNRLEIGLIVYGSLKWQNIENYKRSNDVFLSLVKKFYKNTHLHPLRIL